MSSILEGQSLILDQLLNYSPKSKTLFNIMTWCPLMEGTRKVGPIPSWQFLRHARRWSGLNKVLFKQTGKQLCIFHGNRIKLWLSRSLLSGLLLILLKLGLITRIWNNISNRHNSGNRVINRILLLRLTFHQTHSLIFVLGIISVNTFFDQTSFSDPFFNTHAYGHHLREVVGWTCKHMLIIELI